MAKKQEKGGSVIVTLILIVVLIGLIAALFYVLNMAGVPLPFVQAIKNSNFENALSQNNYQAAYTVYNNSDNKSVEEQVLGTHLEEYFSLCFSTEYQDTSWSDYRGIEVFNNIIKQPVLDKMDETVSNYYNGQYSENDVKIYLNRLGKFSFCKEKLVDSLEEVDKKDASDKAYAKGVECYLQEKFEEAVTEFKKVSASDPNRYPLALDGIERCKNDWGSLKLKEAQKMIDAHNKEGAQALLEELLEIFGTYEEAEALLKTIEPELLY